MPSLVNQTPRVIVSMLIWNFPAPCNTGEGAGVCLNEAGTLDREGGLATRPGAGPKSLKVPQSYRPREWQTEESL